LPDGGQRGGQQPLLTVTSPESLDFY